MDGAKKVGYHQKLLCLIILSFLEICLCLPSCLYLMIIWHIGTDPATQRMATICTLWRNIQWKVRFWLDFHDYKIIKMVFTLIDSIICQNIFRLKGLKDLLGKEYNDYIYTCNGIISINWLIRVKMPDSIHFLNLVVPQ